ncbi:MAG: alkyl/aryl-sulfatase, partial [Bacteroidetes bacterium]
MFLSSLKFWQKIESLAKTNGFIGNIPKDFLRCPARLNFRGKTAMKNHLYALFCLLLMVACSGPSEEIKFEKPLASVEELVRHSDEFSPPEVVKVTDGIYVAIGFGLANSILIEGDGGNIIVDCMESNEAARRVKEAFRAINDRPVKALIYTHNHADHIFGAGVMAGDDAPDIYAHELTNYYIDRLLNIVRPVIEKRSYRMFGVELDAQSRINCGIGPHLDAHPNSTRSLLRPTITFKDTLDTEIAGVKIHLAHVPGETDDQLYVWLPENRVLLSGDNIYKSFPNLYTIRGTPYRDVKEWAQSLDKMRYLAPDFLVPSHTRPVAGRERIQTLLQNYADGIRFVHDQTIRYMNKGLTPDEIVEKVVLPPHLSNEPYLKPFYGRVDWSVRNIFNGYLGWFDGNASTLLPLSPEDKAQKMAELAGGAPALLEKAEKALREGAFQWALELTDYLHRLLPDEPKVADIRVQCLTALGENQSNPNARNYYLTEALEWKGKEIFSNAATPA